MLNYPLIHAFLPVTDEEEEGQGEPSTTTPFILPQVSVPEPAAPAPTETQPSIQNIEVLQAKRLIEEQLVAAGLRQPDPMDKVKALAARMAPTTTVAPSAPVDTATAMKRIQDLAATLIDPVSTTIIIAPMTHSSSSSSSTHV